MDDEAAARLHRAAEMNRDVGRFARRDVELPEQIVEPQPLDPRAKPDPDRAFGIVRARRDHRTFESRIADSGHREQELAGKIGRSEEHTSELQSLMRNSYAVFCL